VQANQDGYDRQKLFDDVLLKLGLFDFSDYGPGAKEFASALSAAGYFLSRNSTIEKMN
jgi:hypothetical protein